MWFNTTSFTLTDWAGYSSMFINVWFWCMYHSFRFRLLTSCNFYWLYHHCNAWWWRLATFASTSPFPPFASITPSYSTWLLWKQSWGQVYVRELITGPFNHLSLRYVCHMLQAAFQPHYFSASLLHNMGSLPHNNPTANVIICNKNPSNLHIFTDWVGVNFVRSSLLLPRADLARWWVMSVFVCRIVHDDSGWSIGMGHSSGILAK